MLTQKNFLPSSSFTISYSRHTKFYVLHTAKVIYFLLIIFSILIPVHSQGSPTCNYATNPQEVQLPQLFCSPQEGQRFIIGQYVTLSWNPSNANLFAPDGNVEIYLFRKRQNATGFEEMVSLDPGNSTAFLVNPIKDNSIQLAVENSWLPSYNYSIQSENAIHTFLFRVIPSKSGDQYDRSFSSPNFMVLGSNQESNSSSAKAVSTPTATDIVSTPSTSINSIDSKTKGSDKSGTSAFIAFIVVASVAAFLAFIAIVIAVRSRKRINNQNKHQSLSNLSASSSTPMITSGKFGNNNRDPESPAEAESIHSTTPLAKEEMRSKPKSAVSFSNENQPISASDAALISDAFRKGLRKPDWKPEDEEDGDTNLSQEERLRRREAKELMKKELAEEGTDLHNISRRLTKVEVRNISDGLERDGVSHSSESESK